MPLPTNPKTPWLPKGWQDIYTDYWEHSAWYSGDANRLSAFYRSNAVGPVPKGRHWAKDPNEVKRAMLHVPIAGDVAATSADLLFSEAPKFIIPKAHEQNPGSDAIYAQERLDAIIENGGVVNRLLEAAENGAALGGVFIKPVWDKDLAPHPILSVAQVDSALPVFRFGILSGITFFKEAKDDDVYYRWLEMYEDGVILNGLYKGTKDELGVRLPLASHPMTQDLEGMDEIKTLIPGLAVEYIPNVKPNRKFRGSALGKSDFAGSESLMDALDETYSSWLRDIRLAQGRLIVPEDWLEVDEGAKGKKSFDVDREVFTSVEMDPLSAQKNGGITIAQFAIRTQEHRDTSLELIDRIIATAGYSPQSFGLQIEGRAESGTALNIRERRSFITKSKKERYWKPSVQRILKLMMLVDRLHLGNTKLKEEFTDVQMEFQDSITNDVTAMATAVELVHRAEAASVETKVRMLHNDWTEDQIAKEVAAIMKERSINMPGPEETDEFNEA